MGTYSGIRPGQGSIGGSLRFSSRGSRIPFRAAFACEHNPTLPERRLLPYFRFLHGGRVLSVILAEENNEAGLIRWFE